MENGTWTSVVLTIIVVDTIIASMIGMDVIDEAEKGTTAAELIEVDDITSSSLSETYSARRIFPWCRL